MRSQLCCLVLQPPKMFIVGVFIASDLIHILTVFLYFHILWKCFCSVQKACLFSHQENKLRPFQFLSCDSFLFVKLKGPCLTCLTGVAESEYFYIVTVVFVETRLTESSGNNKRWILPWLHCFSVLFSWPPGSQHREMMKAECPAKLRDVTLHLRQGLKDRGCFAEHTVSRVLRAALYANSAVRLVV